MYINNKKDLQDLTRLIADQNIIVIDVETSGLNAYQGDQIIGVAVYLPSHDLSYYVSVRHPDSKLDLNLYQKFLDELGHVPLQIGFNYKFDLHFLLNDDMPLPDKVEDVMIAAHTLNENEQLSNGGKIKGAYTLDRLALKYLGVGKDETALNEAAKAIKAHPKKEMYKLPGDLVAAYAEQDVRVTWGLREFYAKGLAKWSQQEYVDLRNEFLLKSLVRMERNGILVDPVVIQSMRDEILPEKEAIEKEIAAIAAQHNLEGFNPGSPAQLLALLKLRGNKVSGTGKDILENLSDPLAKLVLKYRVLQKADTTYYEPYTRLTDENNRLHTSFNMLIVTGRLSSSGPNLQQIPRDSRDYAVKKVFKPTEGYTLFQIDYKQLELRLAVYYAGEKRMQAMFADGTDMHQYTADQLGVSRYQGKTGNFSFLYGMGATTGAVKLGTNKEHASEIIEGWHALYPAFRRASKEYEQLSKLGRNPEGGPGNFQYIRLPNGKIRHFHEYAYYGQYPNYTAWNAFIQGIAANMITEQSILNVCTVFADNEIFRPLVTVHDSFIFEVKDECVDQIVPEVIRIMTDWRGFNPPMAVDVEYSKISWGDLQPYGE